MSRHRATGLLEVIAVVGIVTAWFVKPARPANLQRVPSPLA